MHTYIPVCQKQKDGNTEFFINLGTNAHLDEVYGGYCVFASVPPEDEESWSTVDAIADAIANKGTSRVKINSVTMC
jgi:cyclophilin family peptidyl-prolyl cis-trans isomerase